MNEYQKYMAEHSRLAILRCLKDAPAHQSNDSILQPVLNSHGLSNSRSQIKAHIRWLSEHDCVSFEEVGSVLAVTLTETGLDVANGHIKRDGIQSPSPGG